MVSTLLTLKPSFLRTFLQNEQSAVQDKPHFARIVKLKLFLGSFDRQADQIILTCNRENFVTLEKKDS